LKIKDLQQGYPGNLNTPHFDTIFEWRKVRITLDMRGIFGGEMEKGMVAILNINTKCHYYYNNLDRIKSFKKGLFSV